MPTCRILARYSARIIEVALPTIPLLGGLLLVVALLNAQPRPPVAWLQGEYPVQPTPTSSPTTMAVSPTPTVAEYPVPPTPTPLPSQPSPTPVPPTYTPVPEAPSPTPTPSAVMPPITFTPVSFGSAGTATAVPSPTKPLAAGPTTTPSAATGSAATKPTVAAVLPLAPSVASSEEAPQGEVWFAPLLRTGLTVFGYLWLACGAVAFLGTVVGLLFLFRGRRQVA